MSKKNELTGLEILEKYRELILDNSDVTYEDMKHAIEQLKDLEHYSHYTAGLWCTDRHDIIKDNNVFWQINFWSDKKDIL